VKPTQSSTVVNEVVVKERRKKGESVLLYLR
jgi:hypothetical protein